jgi:flagellar basal-body rod protein FlgB
MPAIPFEPLEPLANGISAHSGKPAELRVKDGTNGAVSFAKVLDEAVARGTAPNKRVIPEQGSQEQKRIMSTHSRHFSADTAREDVQHKLLGIRAYRQQLIASNIANSDTPGYLAVDVDINETLTLNQSRPLPLNTSSTSHMNGSAGGLSPPFKLKYHLPSQVSIDGNTVEMDIERQKFTENSLMYQFSLDRVSGEFKHLFELFQILKD